MTELPLFPLKTVLFPGGPLPLRIFEPRYLDMISDCMRNDHGFGVVLIQTGNETGASAIYEIGTVARIVDWHQEPDGLLGITARGGERFSLRSAERQSDGLQVGVVDMLESEPPVKLPERYAMLAHILEGVLDDLDSHYQALEKRFDDASWVGYRLAEVLPVPCEQKQVFLELDDPVERLELLRPILERLGHDA
ncbi:MAG: LON peptidase substrate-binding domain-containing protein [Pseudomonadota bacterium]